ncbi:phosphatase PAP2/dual specificity phosphatase family protein [Gilliamella sp. Pas-s25]|uniref:phosphatase PAP2/dual specificity phosphatase family protein n=1 Tax=Gilliamella sp. Pas-s25 TaxID=2687310 RepID=UPI00135E5B70|nr:phosphatase PAP2/dual specificity phosphatase family protein [Gilliamella sp. Pas-s25]MWP62894.1 serine/threonine protein phosphatase [Gilliamella sp. Pas-s25]
MDRVKRQFDKLTIYKLVWLVSLTIFFFTSYNFANWFTATRCDVGNIVFEWERSIPLWPWSILPYWSIDLMYGLAILLARSYRTLKILCFRLLSAQIICIICFFLFPLKFSFERPALDGFFGGLFDILMGFDKPFNQAPSLHITLLVILWKFYASYFRGGWRYILYIWCLLIGLSVLTTWSHHFFDIPTGLWVGCFCIWLWPDRGLLLINNCQLPKQYLWSSIYFLLFLLSLCIAIYFYSWALWLLWFSGAFLLVSVNYLLFGAAGFQKQVNGHFNLATTILYLPYFIIMWINSRLWTFKNRSVDLICDNVYLGRMPANNALQLNNFISIVDLCAELPITQFKGNYHLIPVLDMTPLTIKQCQDVAEIIEQYHQQGRLLVCCALGYSRSATAIIAWLLLTKRVPSLDTAIAMVKARRSTIVISAKQRLILSDWLLQIDKGS